MQSISFIKQTVSEKKIFKDFFFENLPFLEPYKSMDTESCHSNQSSYLTGILVALVMLFPLPFLIFFQD